MSYLGPIRLQFSGQFQADPSTVNNDVRHFNNATFQPQFQQLQNGAFLNGWWDPDGSGAFRLLGCTVSMVGYADGTSSQSDPVVGLAIADANARVAGKLVDLDPQQQLVSQIWGLIVRLTDGNHDFFSGVFDMAPFTDIWWTRAQGRGTPGDVGAGSFYQSVIGPVTWGDTSGSQFLQELRAAAPDGMLSIKFNLDGYNMNATSPSYTLGRLVGTIGPASANEPRHFVLGRQLFPQIANQNPAGQMNFMTAVVDAPTRSLIADFGNALPTSSPGGALSNIGTLEIGWLDSANAFHAIDTVGYQQPGWYPNTGGIQAFALSDDQMTTLKTNRVAVAQNGTPLVQENFEGMYARADQFVFRREPGETADVQLWATQYGEPLPNAELMFFHDDSGLQAGIGDPNDGLGPAPPFGQPRDKIDFPKTLPTDAQGRATLPIQTSDPGNPRVYIDGQLYGIRYLLSAIAKQVKANPSFGVNPSDFVSLLVYDAYTPPDELTWYALQPFFVQYGNLYPVMGGIIDMTSYESVVANAHLLSFAFKLPIEDPNHMPVTRDLSAGRREAILRWLENPVRGRPPVSPPPPKMRAVPRPARGAERRAPLAQVDPRDGAKAFAMSRRGVMQIPDETE